MAKTEKNIFSRARLGFQQMYDDGIAYLKTVYGNLNQTFTNASPFNQLFRVILHLGRMIFYYIEDSITELNMLTASRETSVKGLATLTGHVPSRGMGARGSVKLIYNNEKYQGETVTIPNYTKIVNQNTGLQYVIVMPSEYMKMQLVAGNVFQNVSVVQGDIKYQQATGTGYALQSFSFPLPNSELGIVDNYFVNVYVNGERWRRVESILDMTVNEKACIIRTGMNNAIEVFFGTGTNGACPESGATILFEYLYHQGVSGNVWDMTDKGDNYMEFDGDGYFSDGTTVDLNEVLNIELEGELLFGTQSENADLTRLLAPHASRSFVLATPTNYEYFLRRMNMFSSVNVIQGFNTYEDAKAAYNLGTAKGNYTKAKENYIAQANLTGAKSYAARELYDKVLEAKTAVQKAKDEYDNARLDDNTIYLFLIPDIRQRILDTDNYFTCSEDAFLLTDNEKDGIIDLIKSSGQQMLTIDNVITDPVEPRFAINVFVKIWEGYEFDDLKGKIISAVSDYLIANTRKDSMPVSDIIAIIEGIDGIDSVNVSFDADRNNDAIYGKGEYGIDKYGDIVLNRFLTDLNGNKIPINDIYPLFRGGFTSPDGIVYSNELGNDIGSGPINITLRGVSKK